MPSAITPTPPKTITMNKGKPFRDPGRSACFTIHPKDLAQLMVAGLAKLSSDARHIYIDPLLLPEDNSYACRDSLTPQCKVPLILHSKECIEYLGFDEAFAEEQLAHWENLPNEARIPIPNGTPKIEHAPDVEHLPPFLACILGPMLNRWGEAWATAAWRAAETQRSISSSPQSTTSSMSVWAGSSTQPFTQPPTQPATQPPLQEWWPQQQQQQQQQQEQDQCAGPHQAPLPNTVAQFANGDIPPSCYTDYNNVPPPQPPYTLACPTPAAFLALAHHLAGLRAEAAWTAYHLLTDPIARNLPFAADGDVDGATALWQTLTARGAFRLVVAQRYRLLLQLRAMSAWRAACWEDGGDFVNALPRRARPEEVGQVLRAVQEAVERLRVAGFGRGVCVRAEVERANRFEAMAAWVPGEVVELIERTRERRGKEAQLRSPFEWLQETKWRDVMWAHVCEEVDGWSR